MNTDQKMMSVGGLEISVIRKNIKNIHLGVYPPNGRIRVAAPLNTNDEKIQLFVISRIPWIKKQKNNFREQARQTKREYVSGESHYFLGNRYLLNVIHTLESPKIEIKNKNRINLKIKPGTTNKKREELIENFYRGELRKQIPLFIQKWEKKTGVQVKEIKIKKMKTKWGTCKPEYGRMWLNLELAKKPLHCLEYVLVHEMLHFLEKKHTDNFHVLMNSVLPQWKQYKEELNRTILGHNTWEYKGEYPINKISTINPPISLTIEKS